MYPLPNFPQWLILRKTVVEYHNQPTDIDSQDTHLHHHKDASCCLTVTLTPPPPKPLATTVLFLIFIMLLFQECYVSATTVAF